MGGGCPGRSTIVYMSSGMFRGKESSNRIKISQLVQELLNFGVLGSLHLWGGGRWVGGVWEHGGCHHMHTHACKHMYRNCKWPLTWRHPCLSCLACMRVHVCVYRTPPTQPYPTPPPSTNLPPPGGPPVSVKIQ